MKTISLLTKETEKLLDAALRIEGQDVVARGELGFTARSLVACTMPHSKPKGNEFIRTNGKFTLTMLAPSKTGLPYGSLPRLLVAWISTEIVRTKSKSLVLGSSLSEFLRALGLSPTGGAKGDITRLREQMRRLFGCTINLEQHDRYQDETTNFQIARTAKTYWHPQNAEQAGLWESTLLVSDEFFDEVMAAPIPIDLGALKALKRSPLALDLYSWLTFRHSYLKSETVISWEQLRLQFGAEYARPDNFKAAFLAALKKVRLVYPAAKVLPLDTGIQLRPSVPHVPKKRKTLSVG